MKEHPDTKKNNHAHHYSVPNSPRILPRLPAPIISIFRVFYVRVFVDGITGQNL